MKIKNTLQRQLTARSRFIPPNSRSPHGRHSGVATGVNFPMRPQIFPKHDAN